MSRKIPDNIIDRAVELWCRTLASPRFDNGDKSEAGAMSMVLGHMNADSRRSSDHDAKITKFREALTRILRFARDHDGEQKNGRMVYFSAFLDVDYAPCEVLADAANEAGIDPALFSWKSNIYISEDHVGASFGYRAPTINHYPMPDGGWLMTTLAGSDMPKIIEAVRDGRLALEVEQAPAIAA